MKIQHKLDSNITMCLDECVKLPASYETVKQSVEMSMRWAQRSRDAWINRDGYGIFGIQQGGDYQDFARLFGGKVEEIGFDGYAIGGLAVGEGRETMFKVLDYAPGMLPDDKPRYLMGVGRPDDIVGAVLRGVDMFDCVMPTRSGRTAQAFTVSAPLISATPAIVRTRGRWKRAATVRCVPIIPAPICTICKRLTKFWR